MPVDSEGARPRAWEALEVAPKAEATFSLTAAFFASQWKWQQAKALFQKFYVQKAYDGCAWFIPTSGSVRLEPTFSHAASMQKGMDDLQNLRGSISSQKQANSRTPPRPDVLTPPVPWRLTSRFRSFGGAAFQR